MGSTKPSVQLDWINDDAASKYTLPSGAAQLAGHISGTNADPKIFNWCWWRISQWIEFLDNTFDTNGNEINAPNSATITETVTPAASRITLDSDGIKGWDGSINNSLSVTEAGAVQIGYAANNTITSSAGTTVVCTATSADLVKLHAITPSAADINPLLGAQSNGLVVADITKLANIDASAAEIDILDGCTTTYDKLNYLNAAGLVAADLVKLADITPSAADINSLLGASGNGLVVSDITKLANIDASSDEIDRLNSTNGINITLANTSNHGINIVDTNASKHGIYIADAAVDGIKIAHADAYGLNITDAVTAGILIGSVGTGPPTGIHIEDTDGAGIYMEDPGTIGLHIASPGTHAIQIDDTDSLSAILISDAANIGLEITTTTAGAGIEITDAASNGIVITNTTAGSGISISNSASNGLNITTTGGSGVNIANATLDAIHIANAGNDAIEIDTATNHAIAIDGAGGNAIDIDGYTVYGVKIASPGATPTTACHMLFGTGCTAVPSSPQEGMLVYLSDTNNFAYYDGTQWRDIDSTPQ